MTDGGSNLGEDTGSVLSDDQQLFNGIGFVVDRPMTLALLLVAALLVVLPSYRARRAAARAKGVSEGD